jgi:hypothetical protein
LLLGMEISAVQSPDLSLTKLRQQCLSLLQHFYFSWDAQVSFAVGDSERSSDLITFIKTHAQLSVRFFLNSLMLCQ